MSEDVQQVIEQLREGATVLDEPYHHDAIAQVMQQAADLLAQQARCVCCFDNGLVQEWVSKARGVARAKGWTESSCRADALTARVDEQQKIIGRYLENHCANADAEGMSAVCECRLCRDARALLATPDARAEPA